MKSMKKTIVAFSNPFGYGPTGTIIPILKELVGQTKDTRIIFAGSNMCMEIMTNVGVETAILDERSEEDIYAYLKTVPNAYVIGSQNRFCIRAAKRLGIPCAFVDILAWFWNGIPSDHLLADEIFWIKFPGIESKLSQKKVHLVSSIITTASSFRKEKKLLIHIGGAKYPLMNHLPEHYLNLMAKALNEFLFDGYFNKVLFIGGLEAITYIRPRVFNRNISLATLSKEDFMRESVSASYMFTTAGVSSTLESFSMDIPTSFLPPLNLSHLALTDLLKELKACPQELEWNNYVYVKKELRQLTEKDALVEIDSYAKLIDEDKNLSKTFVEDFSKMAKSIPDNSKQQDLIKYMGHSGGREVADILIEKWKLV